MVPPERKFLTFNFLFHDAIFKKQSICKEGTLDSKSDKQLSELGTLTLSNCGEPEIYKFEE